LIPFQSLHSMPLQLLLVLLVYLQTLVLQVLEIQEFRMLHMPPTHYTHLVQNPPQCSKDSEGVLSNMYVLLCTKTEGLVGLLHRLCGWGESVDMPFLRRGMSWHVTFISMTRVYGIKCLCVEWMCKRGCQSCLFNKNHHISPQLFLCLPQTPSTCCAYTYRTCLSCTPPTTSHVFTWM
jgi:hypothetical protein